MKRKDFPMRTRATLVGFFLLAAASAIAAQQTKVPRDPEVIDAQGFQKVLEKYRGKSVVVTFWATWCEPCRDEYPLLNELAKQYAPQGLHVVGINLDDEGDIILMRRFLARYKPIFPNYRKRKGDEAAFNQSVFPGWNGALPATFFYAKDGHQIGHVLGEGNRATYEAAIRALLASGNGTSATPQVR
jgi:thiol-disulfide isomerase/thioredoxin